MAPPPTYEALASAVNYTLLDPEWANPQIVEALESARRYGVAVATVRPSDVDSAARVLAGAAVVVGSVAGYPHGWQTTAVKLYEVRDLLRRGAKDVGAVVGVTRLVSREFQHIQTELNQMAEACHGEGAKLTVLLDAERLSDELKIIACTCCERAEVDCVAALGGLAANDPALLRKHLPDETGIQAGAATLDEALALLEAGVTRIAMNAPGPALADWKRRLAPATS